MTAGDENRARVFYTMFQEQFAAFPYMSVDLKRVKDAVSIPAGQLRSEHLFPISHALEPRDVVLQCVRAVLRNIDVPQQGNRSRPGADE